MKNKILLSLLLILIIDTSCLKNHEYPVKPDASFNISELSPTTGYPIINNDSIPTGQPVNFLFVNTSKVNIVYQVVYWTGQGSNRYSLRKYANTFIGSTGDAYGNLSITYPIKYRGKMDTIVCIATSWGQWGADMKQDIKMKYVKLY